LTVSPEKAPDEPVYIDIDCEGGVPTKVDGKAMKPAELLGTLNKIGGANGVGRVDRVANRFVGLKSRGVYEAPGRSLLHTAQSAPGSLTMDRQVMHLRDSLTPKISELIYYGFWYSPEMEMLRAAVEESQKKVTGTIRLKIYKGNIILAGRRSPNSLYNP